MRVNWWGGLDRRDRNLATRRPGRCASGTKGRARRTGGAYHLQPFNTHPWPPMARLPRLDLEGHLHLVIQRARDALPPFVDDEDRQRYVAALLESSREAKVALHAYALVDDGVLLLATPLRSGSVSRFMQALGRRYVKALNHRHQRSGTPWEGRYRSTIVDPAEHLLACVRLIEQSPVRNGLVARAADWPWSSAAHHVGRKVDPVVTEHAAYWQLGNTPFDRQARHARDSETLLDDRDVRSIMDSARLGWPLGSTSFLQSLEQQSRRPVRPRTRGRPRRAI
ncbi:MAG: transposase [Burkholderiales bacterium]